MEKELEQLGLSDKEVKVYLAALALGPAPAGKIAKQAGIKRPNTYVVLEHLIILGLVSEVVISKEKFFKAEGPEKLKNLTKKMRRKVIAAELKLEELLPELKVIQKRLIEPPKIVFYQGTLGVKNILEDLSASREPSYIFGASEEIIKTLGSTKLSELMEETDRLRELAGRPMSYYVTDKGVTDIKHFKTEKTAAHEIKFLPQTVKPRSAIMLYENKLAVINVSEPIFAAVIESTEVVELVKMMYQLIWKSLSQEKKK